MTGDKPLAPSQLIFSTASNSISTTLTDLKRNNLSITNRLHSIKNDADFVLKVATAYQLPLIANERCGSWYIPPSQKAASAYFKSTDGHYGQWSFSLRRLNLQVMDVIQASGGCIIIDSTRRGKSMPDVCASEKGAIRWRVEQALILFLAGQALSKTVPIWICVLNRLVFPENADWHDLKTPIDVVSRSEHAQIEERLASLVTDCRTLGLDVDGIRSRLRQKPLMPVWLTSNSNILPPEIRETNLIVLCTASGRTMSSPSGLSEYVQGAADDSESWARGLDAETFWAHRERLLSTSEGGLSELIDDILMESESIVDFKTPILVNRTKTVWIGNNAAGEVGNAAFDVIVSCSEKPSETLATRLQDHYIHLACRTGKVGSRQLRFELPKIRHLTRIASPESKILVTCSTGKDLAIGLALAVICLLCDDDGSFQPSIASGQQSKPLIKRRLSWIMIAMPDATPSRATLQSVNAFLLG